MCTDNEALEQLRLVSNITSLHLLQHYLYFQQENDAKDVANTMEEHGFSVELRRSADGMDWLVLATSQIMPTEANVAELRLRLERIASEHSGEYDGWEAAVADEKQPKTEN
ncbi:MAG TPA: ribonuclease E inhibitor RraB [Pirellulales bacterium]|nr:ribonuclease E inhibitor RraB [Pirellulales bacterium]